VRAALIAALVLAVCAGGAGTARADGDPASDMLVLHNVFLPYEAPSTTAAAGLSKQVEAVYTAGYRVKVAVVATKIDLGAIPSLFGNPTNYAKFLGQELSSYYIGPLLIVMPAGYGIYDGGRSTRAENAVLAGLARPASSKPSDLVSAATTAVARLLGAGALKSKDILPPFVETLAGAVKLHTLSVTYYLFDDSGKSAITVTLVRNSQILYMTQVALHVTGNDKPEVRTATLPSGLAVAGARVCVVGVDAAGNRSPPSCKRLVVH
jgi:hypothetical protein